MTDTKAGELAEVIARVRRNLDPDGDFASPYVATVDAAMLCDAASRVAQLEVELKEARSECVKLDQETDALCKERDRARWALAAERTLKTDANEKCDVLTAELLRVKADAERDRTLLQRVAIALESLDLCPAHQGIWFLCPSGCALRMDVTPAEQEEKP